MRRHSRPGATPRRPSFTPSLIRRAGRRIALVFALSLALGALAAAGAQARRSHPRSRVVAQITSPRGVAVSVRLRERHHTQLLAKTAAGRAEQIRVRVPAGRVRVSDPSFVFGGRLYAARASHTTVTVRQGQTVTLRVVYRARRVAHDLGATSITADAVALDWRAHRGADVRLRRAVGAVAPRSVHRGVRVAVSGGQATDAGLAPDTEYSYALFTRVHHHWARPVTLSVGTPGFDSAAYAAPPSTTIVHRGDAYGFQDDDGLILVSLPRGAPMPRLGDAFVLPISRALPGGFLGTVAAISPAGKTVQLTQAGLTDAFTSYDLDAILGGDSELRAVTPAASATGRGGVSGQSSCRAGAFGAAQSLHPSITWAGSFSARLLHRRASAADGARLTLDLDPTFVLAPSVSTSTALRCDVPIVPVIKTVSADPVPISIVFEPQLREGVAGQMSLTGVTAEAQFGLLLNAELGVPGNSLRVTSSRTGSLTNAGQTTISAALQATLGGQLAFGPGAGTEATGSVAGISGSVDPLRARFAPATGAAGAACLTATLGGRAALGLDARPWVGHLPAAERWRVLTGSWSYVPPISEGC